MIPMDLKGFARFLIIVGFILAVAVFQNRILPPGLRWPGDDVLSARVLFSTEEPAAMLVQPDCSAALTAQAAGLETRGAELDGREAVLATWAAELQAQAEELSDRAAELDLREAGLAEREGALVVAESSLQAQRAAFAEQKRQAEALRRWSIGALSASFVILLVSLALVLDCRRTARLSASSTPTRPGTPPPRTAAAPPSRRPRSAAGSTRHSPGR